MKFYIDFEATQFGGRIISIGCINERGQTFQTLCKPSKKGEKVTEFITELTGITNEVLETSPTADEAFNNFFSWVIANSENTLPEYFFFGNSDGKFITNTVKYMKDVRAISFAMSIKSMMTDYSTVCAKSLGVKQIGLKKLYNLLKSAEEPQTHDALEDAKMLMYIESNLKNEIAAGRTFTLPEAAPNNKTNKAPEIFLSWPDGPSNKFAADTKADENNYQVCATNGEKTVYFASVYIAALWVIKYQGKALSPKRQADIQKVSHAIINNYKTECTAYGFYWKVKGKEEE